MFVKISYMKIFYYFCTVSMFLTSLIKRLCPTRIRDYIMFLFISHLKQMIARSVLFVVLGLFFSVTCRAQSTVYFFMRSLTESQAVVSMNGYELFELQGPLKKTRHFTLNQEKKTIHIYSPVCKKCEFKEDGKVLFSVEIKFRNSLSSMVMTYATEIQVNLSEGSIHYLNIRGKGLNDVQIEELTEKKAQKMINSGKYISLPDYVDNI